MQSQESNLEMSNCDLCGHPDGNCPLCCWKWQPSKLSRIMDALLYIGIFVVLMQWVYYANKLLDVVSSNG